MTEKLPKKERSSKVKKSIAAAFASALLVAAACQVREGSVQADRESVSTTTLGSEKGHAIDKKILDNISTSQKISADSLQIVLAGPVWIDAKQAKATSLNKQKDVYLDVRFQEFEDVQGNITINNGIVTRGEDNKYQLWFSGEDNEEILVDLDSSVSLDNGHVFPADAQTLLEDADYKLEKILPGDSIGLSKFRGMPADAHGDSQVSVNVGALSSPMAPVR